MKISSCSYFFLFASFLICLLQKGIIVATCAVEGNVRIDPQGSGEGASYDGLLQVCLFGQWTYVCTFEFDNTDLNVTLHQLGYTGGAYYEHQVDYSPNFLYNIVCVGVERRLLDCPINSGLGIHYCNTIVRISVNNGTRLCKNGEVMQINEILQLCVDGNWRTLCPRLWGPAQAMVACRQLNPGKVVIEGTAKAHMVNGTSMFIRPFFCDGSEKRITECILGDHAVGSELCSGYMVTFMTCQLEPGHIPTNLTLRAVSSGSVEVNWTQPVSVFPQYRVSNHSITCTSSHGVHTTTSQYFESTPAVNESTHIHTIISGLMSNTSYICCVSAHSELGTSESVCDTVITTVPVDKDSGTTSNNFMMSSAVVQSCTIDVRATPCNIQDLDSQIFTPLPWVGGVIIGAVLSTVILLTVLAAVCLWRRKRTHSQHNTSVVSERERTASFSHTNDIYNAAYSHTSPQPYEECQPIRSTEPEYSYATPQTTSTLQQSNSNVMELPVVDNTVLYSMCEEGVQEKKEYLYSEINRK